MVAPGPIQFRCCVDVAGTGCGGARAAELDTLKIEVQLDQRLAGEIDRSPAVELVSADRSGQRVDVEQWSGGLELGGAWQRALEQAGSFKHELESNRRAIETSFRYLAFDLEAKRLAVRTTGRLRFERIVRAQRAIEFDAVNATLGAVAAAQQEQRALLDTQAIDDESRSLRRATIGRVPGCAIAPVSALACHRGAKDRTDDGDLCQPRSAREQAWQRDCNTHAFRIQTDLRRCDGFVDEGDIANCQGRRRPHADFHIPGDTQPISGFGLDAVLDRLDQKSGGNSDHQRQRCRGQNDDKTDGRELQDFHVEFPCGERTIVEPPTSEVELARIGWRVAISKRCERNNVTGVLLCR